MFPGKTEFIGLSNRISIFKKNARQIEKEMKCLARILRQWGGSGFYISTNSWLPTSFEFLSPCNFHNQYAKWYTTAFSGKRLEAQSEHLEPREIREEVAKVLKNQATSLKLFQQRSLLFYYHVCISNFSMCKITHHIGTLDQMQWILPFTFLLVNV